MTKNEFIEKCGSGTLRKASKLGFSNQNLYIEERVAYDFGFEFSRQPSSRITYGKPLVEGDNHFITEAIWHIERYITLRSTDTEKFSCKYIIFEDSDGIRTEGIGIKVEESNHQLFNDGFDIFAIVSIWDNKLNSWQKTVNPF